MGMDQYLLIPFLVGWTSIYQLFWCSPGVQGFDTLPNALKTRPWYALVFSSGSVHCCPIWMVFDIGWCWFSLQKRGPALYLWICGPPKVWQFQETGKWWPIMINQSNWGYPTFALAFWGGIKQQTSTKHVLVCLRVVNVVIIWHTSGSLLLQAPSAGKTVSESHQGASKILATKSTCKLAS